MIEDSTVKTTQKMTFSVRTQRVDTDLHCAENDIHLR